mmetsp:Transcript_14845/g.33800  ORF Transcript_14845/g.33800 Transcript_14845/m.33800 type:complete len:107 (-) Transcript_14845:838-1158(-)
MLSEEIGFLGVHRMLRTLAYIFGSRRRFNACASTSTSWMPWQPQASSWRSGQATPGRKCADGTVSRLASPRLSGPMRVVAAFRRPRYLHMPRYQAEGFFQQCMVNR